MVGCVSISVLFGSTTTAPISSRLRGEMWTCKASLIYQFIYTRGYCSKHLTESVVPRRGKMFVMWLFMIQNAKIMISMGQGPRSCCYIAVAFWDLDLGDEVADAGLSRQWWRSPSRMAFDTEKGAFCYRAIRQLLV